MEARVRRRSWGDSGRNPGGRSRILARALALFCLLAWGAGEARADEALLWKIADARGAVVYLLGSLHMAKESLYPLKPAILEAFDRSTRIVVEVNDDAETRSPEVIKFILEKGSYPLGETLLSHLDPETRDLAAPHLEGFPGVHTSLKPWLAATLIEVLALEKKGYLPRFGVDRYFLDEAKRRSLPIGELETATEQLSHFADMDEEMSQLFLKVAILEIEKIDAFMVSMVSAWTQGDEAAFERIFFETYYDWPEFAPLLDRVLYGRNDIMVERLKPYFREDGATFAIVGSGHAVGPRGIPAKFREMGYSVEKY